MSAGWFIRAIHGWGSNFMVAVVLIHMVQVFLFGAYKFPRELTWIVGVFLLLMTLGMAFTGQVMRFDQDAYWGLGIGASISSRIPLIGAPLVKLLLGGPIIAGATLSRFFALHVFVIPGMLIGFVGLHLLMVREAGDQRVADAGSPRAALDLRRGVQGADPPRRHSLRPRRHRRDLVFSGVILLAIVFCALFLGPFGPGGRPDPTIIQTAPKPDFFFLWLYATLSFLPPAAETPFLLIAPAVGILGLVLLPFLSGRGREELAPAAHRRAHRHSGRGRPRLTDPARAARPLEPGDGRLEQRAHPRGHAREPQPARAAGRAGVPGQAVPRLPRPGWQGRRARATTRRRWPSGSPPTS